MGRAQSSWGNPKPLGQSLSPGAIPKAPGQVLRSWATPSFQTLAREEVLRRWALESIKRQRLAVSGDKSVIKRYLDQKNSDAMDVQKPDQFLQDLESLFSSSAMP